VNIVFYLSAAVAVLATAMVITRSNAMHALLYLVISFLAISLVFFTLGAPFIAALEVIIYAGAIMVLFLFVIMLLNVDENSIALEKQWLRASGWIGPVILALILLGEVIYVLSRGGLPPTGGSSIPPQQVGTALFSTYLIGVELSSILLLASLVGAYHIGRRKKGIPQPQQAAAQGMQAEPAAGAAAEENRPEALEVEKER
jgi:NADH-quinone oxidoreductase subunit J